MNDICIREQNIIRQHLPIHENHNNLFLYFSWDAPRRQKNFLDSNQCYALRVTNNK